MAALLLAMTAAQAQPNISPPAIPAPTEAPRPESGAAAKPDSQTDVPAATQPSSTLPWARIEQIRRGNRVAEINVTSGTGAHRYSMVNREGRPPLSTQELSSGLSTPQFFKFEF